MAITPGRRVLATVGAFLLVIGWQLGQPLTAFADGPTTFTNSASIDIPAAGSANQTGPASPYPSNVTVSGMTGVVSKVSVRLNSLTHASVNDVDALVVAPSGENLVVLSDVGAPATLTFANNATLTFDDAAPGVVPTGNVPTGTYRPTNNGATDSFAAPAPSASNNTSLSGAFTGIDPNGTWRLYIMDDTTGDLGSLSGGWSVIITTEETALATTTTVASSDTTSTTGGPVTFTATVRAGGSPVTAGTVQFNSDGTNIGAPVPLNGSGVATLTTSALTEGTHLIRATFSGSTGFLSSNGTITQRVDNATVVTGTTFCNTGTITVPTTGVGAASPYPSNIFVSGLSGQITKVTAQLKDVSHTAPIDFDILLSGPTATSNVFLMSDAGGQVAVSNVNLTFDDDAASPIGSPVTSGTYRPTRMIDETAENLPAPAPPISGATTLSTFDGQVANGTWSLWVVDDATGDVGSISGGWCLTITSQAPTSTALTASPNPSSVGDSVTFTAAVNSGGSPVTTGAVQFSEGATNLGAPVTVASDGTATLTTSALSAGTHRITATYLGTDTLAESSDELSQVVNRVVSTTTVTSSVNPSAFGDSVTFTATVVANGVPLTSGDVTFSISGTDQAPVPLSAQGEATLTTSSLPAGTHVIGARYAGTVSATSSTASLDQVVGQQASSTTVTASPNPADFGATVTLVATVTAGGAPVTSGTVQFSVGGTPVGPSLPVQPDGTVTITQTGLSPGTIVFTATFSGTNDVAGSSGTVSQVVDGRPTVTVLTGPATSELGESVTFTATVTTDGTPVTSGSVVFSDGGNPLTAAVGVDGSGQATLTTSDLALAQHSLTVAYSDAGGEHLASESAVLTHEVVLTVTVGGPYTVAEGASFTLAATGSPGASYEWDLNDDGTFGDATGLTPTLTWAQVEALGINDGPGTWDIAVRAVVGGVHQPAQTGSLSVTNTAPASVLTGDLTATVGQPFTIKVGADDPSSADMAAMFTYTVDWGDGSPVESVVGPADPPVTHTYTAKGEYNAVFSAQDKDGGRGPGQTVVVLAAEDGPSPSPSPTRSSGRNDLPQTGADADPTILVMGLALVAVGALVTVASLIGRSARRRP